MEDGSHEHALEGVSTAPERATKRPRIGGNVASILARLETNPQTTPQRYPDVAQYSSDTLVDLLSKVLSLLVAIADGKRTKDNNEDVANNGIGLVTAVVLELQRRPDVDENRGKRRARSLVKALLSYMLEVEYTRVATLQCIERILVNAENDSSSPYSAPELEKIIRSQQGVERLAPLLARPSLRVNILRIFVARPRWFATETLGSVGSMKALLQCLGEDRPFDSSHMWSAQVFKYLSGYPHGKDFVAKRAMPTLVGLLEKLRRAIMASIKSLETEAAEPSSRLQNIEGLWNQDEGKCFRLIVSIMPRIASEISGEYRLVQQLQPALDMLYSLLVLFIKGKNIPSLEQCFLALSDMFEFHFEVRMEIPDVTTSLCSIMSEVVASFQTVLLPPPAYHYPTFFFFKNACNLALRYAATEQFKQTNGATIFMDLFPLILGEDYLITKENKDICKLVMATIYNYMRSPRHRLHLRTSDLGMTESYAKAVLHGSRRFLSEDDCGENYQCMIHLEQLSSKQWHNREKLKSLGALNMLFSSMSNRIMHCTLRCTQHDARRCILFLDTLHEFAADSNTRMTLRIDFDAVSWARSLVIDCVGSLQRMTEYHALLMSVVTKILQFLYQYLYDDSALRQLCTVEQVAETQEDHASMVYALTQIDFEKLVDQLAPWEDSHRDDRYFPVVYPRQLRAEVIQTFHFLARDLVGQKLLLAAREGLLITRFAKHLIEKDLGFSGKDEWDKTKLLLSYIVTIVKSWITNHSRDFALLNGFSLIFEEITKHWRGCMDHRHLCSADHLGDDFNSNIFNPSTGNMMSLLQQCLANPCEDVHEVGIPKDCAVLNMVYCATSWERDLSRRYVLSESLFPLHTPNHAQHEAHTVLECLAVMLGDNKTLVGQGHLRLTRSYSAALAFQFLGTNLRRNDHPNTPHVLNTRSATESKSSDSPRSDRPTAVAELDFDVEFAFPDTDRTVRSSRAALSHISPVFRAMFSQTYSESNQETIRLEDANIDTVETFVNHVHEGCPPFNYYKMDSSSEQWIHVLRIFACADRYLVSSLVHECEIWLQQAMKNATPQHATLFYRWVVENSLIHDEESPLLDMALRRMMVGLVDLMYPDEDSEDTREWTRLLQVTPIQEVAEQMVDAITKLGQRR